MKKGRSGPLEISAYHVSDKDVKSSATHWNWNDAIEPKASTHFSLQVDGGCPTVCTA
jgi:hypothetical protein